MKSAGCAGKSEKRYRAHRTDLVESNGCSVSDDSLMGVPIMTRKDFEAIAEAIRVARLLRVVQDRPDALVGVDLMIVAIMDACKERNDNFNEVQFLRACGL